MSGFSFSYPDTLLSNFAIENTINSFDNFEFFIRGDGGWKDNISFNKYGRVMFCVVSTDTLKKYGWSDVKKNYRILQRFDITVDDMESRDWEIEYPYDPAKGKLKVWPK